MFDRMGWMRRWWPLVVSGLVGAVIAGVVITFTAGGHADVRPVPAAHAARPTSTEQPRLVFIGDSWTEGFGATPRHGYAVLTGERLGWDYEVLGVGGSGYVVPGRGSTYEQRIDRAVQFHPDVVVVQGSINERRTDLDLLATAAERTLGELKAQAGDHTRILVLGASYVPGEKVRTVRGINDTIAAAAADVGLPFVNPATQNWSDPQDASIWADSKHLNDRGAGQVADHLVPLLREMVRG